MAHRLFEQPRVVGKPNHFDKRALYERMDAMIDAAWYTNFGPQVQALQERFAKAHGAVGSVAVANATLGLSAALRAVGEPGQRVLVPAFTFPGTAQAVLSAGFNVVLADVDAVTHLLDPTTASGPFDLAMPVHLWGASRNWEGLGVPVIVDAAHAVGCAAPPDPSVVASAYSLHATKFVSAFEGGLVTADDADVLAKVRRAATFGFEGDRTSHAVGTNAKMSEVHAAMAHVSLDGLEELLAHHRAVHARYSAGLTGVSGVRVWTFDPEPNHQYVVLELARRDALVAALREVGVVAAPYFTPPLHHHPITRSSKRFPVAERLADQCVCLPTGTQMSLEDVDRVTAFIRGWM